MLLFIAAALSAAASSGTTDAGTARAASAVPAESAVKSATRLLLEPLLSALARRGHGGGAPPDRLGRALDAALELSTRVWRTLAGALHALGATEAFEERALRHSRLSIAVAAAFSLAVAVSLGLLFGGLFSRGRPPAGWRGTARPVDKRGRDLRVTAASPPKRAASPVRRRKPHGGAARTAPEAGRFPISP